MNDLSRSCKACERWIYKLISVNASAYSFVLVCNVLGRRISMAWKNKFAEESEAWEGMCLTSVLKLRGWNASFHCFICALYHPDALLTYVFLAHLVEVFQLVKDSENHSIMTISEYKINILTLTVLLPVSIILARWCRGNRRFEVGAFTGIAISFAKCCLVWRPTCQLVFSWRRKR